MTSRQFLKRFFIGSSSLLLLCIAVVVIFDPFFQYHKALPGLKAVLADKEYQVVGTLKNFDYDSVVVGSSVAEMDVETCVNHILEQLKELLQESK